ncbi:MAG: NAD(P)H-dependent oxidoreductase [Desulfotignum sp.]|nr:NAD(P)H-dependent oxidoreductase [Desulfotignum sp.]
MLVLGLQGSPRKKGNSVYLLNRFLEECKDRGARTEVIHMDGLDIQPCRELVVCEKKGFCPLKDEMESHIYGLIRRADVVVLASPVFFYNVSAQAKVLIDRCQMFWGRRYKMKLADPDAGFRQGVLLAVGASGGKRLFEGVELTAHYFFDAVSARFAQSLTYKKVEAAGAVADVPGVDDDIRQAAGRVMDAVQNKPCLVFVSKNDACRSQMAAAYAKMAVKGSIRVLSAGMDPARDIHPAALCFLADQGIDIKYRQPRFLDTLIKEEFENSLPFQVVCMEPDLLPIPGVNTLFWDLPETQDASNIAVAGNQIRTRVDSLVSDLQCRNQSG